MISCQFSISRAVSTIVLGALVFNVTGCSITGFSPDVDPNSTASVQPIENNANLLQETVDPSDWEKIRSVIVTALDEPRENSPIQWENDITGSVGTIIPLEVVSKDTSGLCRKFSTTLNSVGGITQYAGDACRSAGGEVELVGVAPKEALAEATPQTAAKPKAKVQ